MHVLSILSSLRNRSISSLHSRSRRFIRFILHSLSARVLFDYSALSNLDAKGNDVDLSIYNGNVLLIVNVASQCGLTNSNYTELNQLYEKYKDKAEHMLEYPLKKLLKEKEDVMDVEPPYLDKSGSVYIGVESVELYLSAGGIVPWSRYDPIGPPDVPSFDPSCLRRPRHLGGAHIQT